MLSGNPIHALLTFLEGYLLQTAQHPSEPFDRALMLIDGLMDAGYLSQPEESYLTDLRVEALAWGRARQDKEEADHVVSELLAPNPRPGLRLLCVLVRKAGRCAVVQPISVYGLPAPGLPYLENGRWTCRPRSFCSKHDPSGVRRSTGTLCTTAGNPRPSCPCAAFQLEG